MGALGAFEMATTPTTDDTGVTRELYARHRRAARAGRTRRLDRRAEPLVPRLAPASPELRRARVRSRVFLLIVLACALAPVYAKHVAHTDPDTNHITDSVKVGDKA